MINDAASARSAVSIFPGLNMPEGLGHLAVADRLARQKGQDCQSETATQSGRFHQAIDENPQVAFDMLALHRQGTCQIRTELRPRFGSRMALCFTSLRRFASSLPPLFCFPILSRIALTTSQSKDRILLRDYGFSKAWYNQLLQRQKCFPLPTTSHDSVFGHPFVVQADLVSNVGHMSATTRGVDGIHEAHLMKPKQDGTAIAEHEGVAPCLLRPSLLKARAICQANRNFPAIIYHLCFVGLMTLCMNPRSHIRTLHVRNISGFT